MTLELRFARAAGGGRAGGRARPPPRPRRRRARPLPPARRARPGAAAARDHAARPAGAAAGRRALVPARGHPHARPRAPSSRRFEPAAAFLDGLPVPIERVVLGGFSQGAVMSWALGLGSRPAAARRDHRPLRLHARGRGLRARPRRPRGLSRSPSAHGSLDPVIPVEFGRARPSDVRAGGRRSPLARNAGPAHDRPARSARAAGLRAAALA